jgi:hypothetical protein
MTKINSTQNASLSETVKTVFSWIILVPIAIIFSGIFLKNYLEQKDVSLKYMGFHQFLIVVKPILKLKAIGKEVIYGFSAFLITLFISGITFGHWICKLVNFQFGKDFSKFEANCFFCALLTLTWTFLLFLFGKKTSGIDDISNKQNFPNFDLWER